MAAAHVTAVVFWWYRMRYYSTMKYDYLFLWLFHSCPLLLRLVIPFVTLFWYIAVAVRWYVRYSIQYSAIIHSAILDDRAVHSDLLPVRWLPLPEICLWWRYSIGDVAFQSTGWLRRPTHSFWYRYCAFWCRWPVQLKYCRFHSVPVFDLIPAIVISSDIWLLIPIILMTGIVVWWLIPVSVSVQWYRLCIISEMTVDWWRYKCISVWKLAEEISLMTSVLVIKWWPLFWWSIPHSVNATFMTFCFIYSFNPDCCCDDIVYYDWEIILLMHCWWPHSVLFLCDSTVVTHSGWCWWYIQWLSSIVPLLRYRLEWKHLTFTTLWYRWLILLLFFWFGGSISSDLVFICCLCCNRWLTSVMAWWSYWWYRYWWSILPVLMTGYSVLVHCSSLPLLNAIHWLQLLMTVWPMRCLAGDTDDRLTIDVMPFGDHLFSIPVTGVLIRPCRSTRDLCVKRDI